jgi:two-component system phosphate regulon sensor histidine kinase PhoR
LAGSGINAMLTLERAMLPRHPMVFDRLLPVIFLVAGASCLLIASLAAPISYAIAIMSGVIAAAFIMLSVASFNARGKAIAPDAAHDDAATGDKSWRIVVEAMPDAALILGSDGRILYSSRTARDLFPRLMLGQPVAQLSRSPELLEAIEATLNSKSARVVQSLERVPIERRLSATISPLRTDRADAEAPALLIVFRDVSEEERLAQMRSDFIANASHELRTPLTSLKGFIETLQGQARDDPAARNQFLDIMSAQAGRMSRLLDDLLSLSRLEMRAHVPPRGEVEINELVLEIANLLEPIARESDIALTSTPAAERCVVRGDRDELVQVFQNLIQNAIKYGRRGGKVGVHVLRESPSRGAGPRVLVEVVDDGPGIAEEHLPRLTERFYRVDVAASRDKGGTGLGLAIVKHVLNRHHGQLRISSAPGRGSAFTVVLDLITPARAGAEEMRHAGA